MDFGYEPSELFDFGINGEMVLLKCDSLGESKGAHPETYQITMPSSMKLEPTSGARIISDAAHLELRLRAGQCNNSLQGT